METERINMMLDPHLMGPGPILWGVDGSKTTAHKPGKKSSSGLMKMMKPALAALLGGTIAGMLVSGESAIEVATTMNGALGSTIGYTIGSYLYKNDDVGVLGKMAAYAPLAMAIGVPSLIEGRVDMVTVALGLGSAGGVYALQKM